MPWSGIALALALSADGFFVGLLYGVRRILIPWPSIALVGLCSAAGMALSMVFGEAVARTFPPRVADWLGGAILISIGIWQLCQGWAEVARGREAEGSDTSAIDWRFHLFGVAVRILIDPVKADRDRSGRIEAPEALALGIALGLDTLAAGFAAAILGYGASLILLVAIGLVGMVWIGVALGRGIGPHRLGGAGALLPGALLVLLGLFHLVG